MKVDDSMSEKGLSPEEIQTQRAAALHGAIDDAMTTGKGVHAAALVILCNNGGVGRLIISQSAVNILGALEYLKIDVLEQERIERARQAAFAGQVAAASQACDDIKEQVAGLRAVTEETP